MQPSRGAHIPSMRYPSGSSDERTARASGSRVSYLRVLPHEVRGEPLERHVTARRVLNVAVGAIGILLTLPIWIVIAALVKLTSRGPVFHTQIRVGLDNRNSSAGSDDPRRRHDIGGKPFTIYKFRTMYETAEKNSGPVWATKNDPRVTWIGRVLRQYRLDELPQLINVLKGEMNVVGPRPERPTIFAELRESIPNYRLRQRALPGITGLAQVRQQYDSCLADVERKVKFDLEYVRRRGFWHDLKIMLETIPVILLRKGGW
jgi:lipopolysaccharide/colanic/teichoic acid biosynthesis glycosyltransferase